MHSCAGGRSGNLAAAAGAEQRAGVSWYEAAKSGGEALQRSTRFPGGGAARRSAGMRPNPLSETRIPVLSRKCFVAFSMLYLISRDGDWKETEMYTKLTCGPKA
ncbi:MAG: hypothetical protein U5P10_08340 [Spirochaetia bacterium]|nr:hypothetical protein [Spirochaetia bacterium]